MTNLWLPGVEKEAAPAGVVLAFSHEDCGGGGTLEGLNTVAELLQQTLIDQQEKVIKTPVVIPLWLRQQRPNYFLPPIPAGHRLKTMVGLLYARLLSGFLTRKSCHLTQLQTAMLAFFNVTFDETEKANKLLQQANVITCFRGYWRLSPSLGHPLTAMEMAEDMKL